MTGMLQAVAAGAVKGVVTFTLSLGDSKAGAAAQASIGFNGDDGTLIASGSTSTINGNPGNQGGSWYNPSVPGLAGAGCNVSIVVNSGTAPTSGSQVNAILQMVTNPTWFWTQNAVGTMSANCTIKIFDGSLNLLTSTTFTVSVTRTS